MKNPIPFLKWLRPGGMVLVALLLMAGASAAQPLTAAECAQIERNYGVTPDQCPSRGAAPAAFPPALPAGSPTLSEPTQEMRQNNIFFQRGGEELSPEALLQIQQIAGLLNGPTMERACLKLVGHSDATGSALVNREMGTLRAIAVRNRLGLLLDTPGRIEAIQSMGEDLHLPGLPPESPWQRRVEIWVRDCPG